MKAKQLSGAIKSNNMNNTTEFKFKVGDKVYANFKEAIITKINGFNKEWQCETVMIKRPNGRISEWGIEALSRFSQEQIEEFASIYFASSIRGWRTHWEFASENKQSRDWRGWQEFLSKQTPG